MKTPKLAWAIRAAIASSVTATAAGLSLPALAQNNNAMMEEIIVSARKRDETLTEVPMNISAVGAVEIEKRNLVSKEDLFRTLPGASMPRGQLILRGLSGGNDASPDTTSTFTDGVLFNFSDLFDVSRVEVLRGPQGTLWGSNAIGGTVQVISNKPDPTEFEVFGSLQTSAERNVDGHETRAYIGVNLPLGDSMALRVVGSSSNEPGRILNAATGNVNSDDENWTRAQLLWNIDDDSELTVGYWHTEERALGSEWGDVSSGGRYVPSLTANPSAPNGYDVTYDYESCGDQGRVECMSSSSFVHSHPSKYTIWESVDEWFEREKDLFTLAYTNNNIADIASFSYVGSYADTSTRELANWSRNDLLDAAKTWILEKDTNLYGRQPGERVTHELRFQSIGDGAISWTAGYYFNKYELDAVPDMQFQYHETSPEALAITTEVWTYWGYITDWDLPGVETIDQFGEAVYGDPSKNYNIAHEYTRKEEHALYGEVSYLTDLAEGELELTAGVRFYDIEDEQRVVETGVWVGPGGAVTDEGGGNDGDTLKFSASYRPSDDLSFYAVYSEGYRPGGSTLPILPVSCQSDPNAQFWKPRFESDTIENYEFGIKGALFERRFRFSSAIYTIDWTGLQTRVDMDTCGFPFTGNAASAESSGFEFESTTFLTDTLTATLNFSYSSTELTSDAPSFGGLKGEDLSMVPSYNFYAALDKTFDVMDRPASLRLEVEGYDEYKSHYRASELDIAPDYTRWNASASIEASDSVRLSVHVNNLLNEEIITYRTDTSNQDLVYYAPERTLTVRADVAF